MDGILFAAAAITTIAGFLLEVWRELKPFMRTNDEGKKKKSQY